MGNLQLYLLAFSLAGHHVSGATLPQPRAKPGQPGQPSQPEIDYFSDSNVKWITAAMDRYKVPGTSIAIIDGDRDQARGFGFARKNPDVEATEDTLYMAGSTTKAQTAACLSHLIHSGQHGNINWTTPIKDILKDDFKLKNEEATNSTTLNDAVSHRSGLPRHDRALTQRDAVTGKTFTTQEIVRSMKHLPFVNKPREKFIYGNYMFITLSYVVEKMTGKPLAEVMRKTLWEPLNMTSTYFGLQEVMADRAIDQLAHGYMWGFGKFKDPWVQAERMPLTTVSGSAAVISNVKDYAKWVRALLTQSGPLSEAVHQDIRTPRGADNDDGMYALAWHKDRAFNRTLYWHNGAMIGQKSLIYWLPEDNFGVVIFANGDAAKKCNYEVAQKLVATRLGKTDEEANITISHIKDLTGDDDAMKTNMKDFYPELKDAQLKPLPPVEALKEYVGKYCSDSYGNVNITAVEKEDEAKGLKKGLLLIERPELTWHLGYKLRQVSEKHWIAAGAWLEDMYPGPHEPAEFIRGADGKPSGLRIHWHGDTRPTETNGVRIPEGAVEFTRCGN